MIAEILSSYMPKGLAQTVTTGLILTVVILGFYLFGRVVFIPTLEKLLKQRDIKPHARKPLLKVSWFILLLLSVTIGFGAAGLGNFLTALSTISAAGTLAIGFAMQNVIKNFVSGVFIFIDQPFKIGDWIVWNEYSGHVEDIDLRVTKVRTFDNELLTVPNSKLSDNTVKNPVDADQLRLNVEFGIGYEENVAKATSIILEEADKNESIMSDPEPSVRVVNLNDSSVDLQSRLWISDPSRSDYVSLKGDFVTDVKHRFDEEGIEIPYPKRDISGEIKT